ncbi:hypothetical protein DBR11_03315 [Pedobacter sp. HMWF019]|nr:hypothetical protein DBR11_03315 [Pedobacter sp. HMWF019]
MRYTPIIYIALLFCIVNLANVQITYNKLPVIIPSASNAAELSKYGILDVGFKQAIQILKSLSVPLKITNGV